MNDPVALTKGFVENPTPRMQMIDGFNEGWIEFDGGQENSLKGEATPEAVFRSSAFEQR
jgi:NAD(P)H dehydrogenase (quinone)